MKTLLNFIRILSRDFAELMIGFFLAACFLAMFVVAMFVTVYGLGWYAIWTISYFTSEHFEPTAEHITAVGFLVGILIFIIGFTFNCIWKIICYFRDRWNDARMGRLQYRW